MSTILTMACSFHFILFCFLLFPIIITPTIAKTPVFLPKAALIPVTKDASTKQYVAKINQRTPLVPVKLTVDLGGDILLVGCEKGYVSSTYKPARCGSAQCNLAGQITTNCEHCSEGPKPGCNNNTCSVFPYNPFTLKSTGGELAQDIISIHSTNGLNLGKKVSARNIVFSCGNTFLLEGLASGVTGIAGLGWRNITLPYQFASVLKFQRKFALCLTGSSRANGVLFFGGGPYVMQPNKDVSQNLIYTPLIRNRFKFTTNTVDLSPDYFIGVKSIKINDKAVQLNNTLLSISPEDGTGGTKISTSQPYTTLETSIYKAVVGAFAKALAKVPRVKAVAPFGICFDSSSIGSTRVGPAVPQIDFVLENNQVWTVFGANSMVQVRDGVSCLGFVDGGKLYFEDSDIPYSPTAIIIGGHQIEDNLLEFDLVASRLGFSSSLLFRQTSCSNFNFTYNAYNRDV